MFVHLVAKNDLICLDLLQYFPTAIRVDNFNGAFDLFVNNMVQDIVVNEYLFMFLSSEYKIVSEEDKSLARYIRFLIIAFLYCSGHSLL